MTTTNPNDVHEINITNRQILQLSNRVIERCQILAKHDELDPQDAVQVATREACREAYKKYGCHAPGIAAAAAALQWIQQDQDCSIQLSTEMLLGIFHGYQVGVKHTENGVDCSKCCHGMFRRIKGQQSDEEDQP